jgi:hypothetical protein
LRPFPNTPTERWREGLQHRSHLDRQGKHRRHLSWKRGATSLTRRVRSVYQLD